MALGGRRLSWRCFGLGGCDLTWAKTLLQDGIGRRRRRLRLFMRQRFLGRHNAELSRARHGGVGAAEESGPGKKNAPTCGPTLSVEGREKNGMAMACGARPAALWAVRGRRTHERSPSAKRKRQLAEGKKWAGTLGRPRENWANRPNVGMGRKEAHFLFQFSKAISKYKFKTI